MASQQTEEKYLKRKDLFRRNAFFVITEMGGLAPKHPSVLVDEVLHSIFFLGQINNPRVEPEDIVSDEAMLNRLKELYPGPFEQYSSTLPKRSPLSCVLDMIVNVNGQEKENEIITWLQNLIRKLKEDEAVYFVSSTICVSKRREPPSAVRYYGLSSSASGPNPGRILVAASCLSGQWDNFVADAVMTYDSKKKKKDYFDGTIKLPANVTCQALNLSERNEMLPCQSCANLFGFTENGGKEWPYGNCAEVESISNMFKNDSEVKESARPTSPLYTEENRQKAIESVMKDLQGWLRTMQFRWNRNFYTPRGVYA